MRGVCYTIRINSNNAIMFMRERGGPSPEDIEGQSAPQEVDLGGVTLRVGEMYELPSVAGGEPSTVRIREFDPRGGSVMFDVLDEAGNVRGTEGGDVARFTGARAFERGVEGAPAAEAAAADTVEHSETGIGSEREFASSDVSKYQGGAWYPEVNPIGLIRRINGTESNITVVEVPRTVMVHSNSMGQDVRWKVEGFAKKQGFDLYVTRELTAQERRQNPEAPAMGKDIRFSEIVG